MTKEGCEVVHRVKIIYFKSAATAAFNLIFLAAAELIIVSSPSFPVFFFGDVCRRHLQDSSQLKGTKLIMEEGGFEKLSIGCQRWMSKISAFKSQLIVQGSAKTTAEDKENVQWHQLLKDRRVPSRTPAEKKKNKKTKTAPSGSFNRNVHYTCTKRRISRSSRSRFNQRVKLLMGALVQIRETDSVTNVTRGTMRLCTHMWLR